MTSLLVAAVISSIAPVQSSQVVETLSSMPGVRVEAVVMLPEMGPRQRAILQYLVEMLPEGSRTFTGDQYRRSSLEAGTRFRVGHGPDHLRISLGAADLSDALVKTFSLLTEPTLSQTAFDAAKERLPWRPGDRWSRASNPERLQLSLARRDLVQEFQIETFVPARVTLAISGAFGPGEAAQKWSEMIVSWPRPPRTRFNVDRGPTQFWANVPGKVGMIEFRGPTFTHRPTDAQLLALAMLGDTKTGSLFRVVREKLGISYLSQAVLVPTREGWRPRILIPTLGGDLGVKALEARKALLEDISAWGQAQLELGVRVATRGFSFQNDGRPPIAVDGVFAASPEDRAYLQAYWMAKVGQPWPETTAWEARFSSVNLEDVQEAARVFVDTGAPVILPGSG